MCGFKQGLGLWMCIGFLAKSSKQPTAEPSFHGPATVLLSGWFPKDSDQFPESDHSGTYSGPSLLAHCLLRAQVQQWTCPLYTFRLSEHWGPVYGYLLSISTWISCKCFRRKGHNWPTTGFHIPSPQLLSNSLWYYLPFYRWCLIYFGKACNSTYYLSMVFWWLNVSVCMDGKAKSHFFLKKKFSPF